MASIGMVLRTERESQGRAIADIAEELCIMPAYLRAIENDDLANLPGTFFYKSFVKQYASLLGLDPAALRADVAAQVAKVEPLAEVAETPAHTAPDFVEWKNPIRVPDAIAQAANRLDVSNRPLAMPIAALVVTLAGGGAFYNWWKQPAIVAVRPAVTQPAVTQPAVTQGVETSRFVPQASPTQPVSQQVSDPAAQSPAQPGTVVKTTETPGLNVTTTTNQDGVRQVQLNISAKEATWLSVTIGGKRIFSGMLQADESTTLTGLDTARLVVGNAGGLDVQLNGKEVGPLGERGQVKEVVFTPEGFSIVRPGETL